MKSFTTHTLLGFLGLFLVLVPIADAQTTGRGASASVIGGADVPAGLYRSVGALAVADPKKKPSSYVLDAFNTFCSATLIAPKVILTAAHCLRAGKRYRDPTVIFNKKNLIDPGSGKRRRVKDIVVHPGYSRERHSGDIGLGFLSAPITSIDPMPIPVPDVDPELRFTDVVAAAGWGRWTYEGIEGAFGLKGPLKIAWGRAAGATACKKKSKLFADNHLCMTGIKRWGSLCYGDSGGPLVLLDDSGAEPGGRSRLLPPRRVVGVNSAVFYHRKGEGCTRKAIDVFESMGPSSSNNAWVRKVFEERGLTLPN